LAKPIAAVGVVVVLLVSGVALAAFWPSPPTAPGGDAVGSNGFMAAADHDRSPYPEGEPPDLSVVAQIYASAVAAWADCVSVASGEGLEASLVLERCSSLRPDPLDDTGFGTVAPPPVLAMRPSATPMGHEIEGLDLDPGNSVRYSPEEAAPPADSAPPSSQPDPETDDAVGQRPDVAEPPDDPAGSDDGGEDGSVPPVSEPDDGGGEDSPTPEGEGDGGGADDDDDDQGDDDDDQGDDDDDQGDDDDDDQGNDDD
jgi:hypothetical protein